MLPHTTSAAGILWWALLAERHTGTPDQQHTESTYWLAVIGDAGNARQREVLHKLRSIHQEHSEIDALSDRFYVVRILIGEYRKHVA